MIRFDAHFITDNKSFHQFSPSVNLQKVLIGIFLDVFSKHAVRMHNFVAHHSTIFFIEHFISFSEHFWYWFSITEHILYRKETVEFYIRQKSVC